MTSSIMTDWTALVTAHTTAYAIEQASNDRDAMHTASEHDAIDKAEWDARLAVLNAPAQEMSHMIHKLTMMIEMQGMWKGDTIESLPFLQRLLDEQDVDGGFPLVRLLQDSYRLANIDHPILSLSCSKDKQWAELSDAFKTAHAFINRPETDEVTEKEAADFQPIRDAMYLYPVANLNELAEKVALIKLDDGDQGFEALAADIERLRG